MTNDINPKQAFGWQQCSSVVCHKIRSAVNELKQTKSAWLEIAFACMALAAGGWSLYQPYTSQWFEASPYAVFCVFFGCGLLQLGAFVWREAEGRQSAAVVNGCIWLGVSYILITDNVPGWMTSVGPVIVIFQAIVWKLLDVSPTNEDVDREEKGS